RRSMLMNDSEKVRLVPRSNGRVIPPVFEERDRSLQNFIILCAAMFLNFVLAFLHARGRPMSSGIVIVVQALVTFLVLPHLLSLRSAFGIVPMIVVCFLVFCSAVTNVVDPFSAMSIYDVVLMPIFIA